jgi:phosphoribosylaminoimidazole (AIR) synthetase
MAIVIDKKDVTNAKRILQESNETVYEIGIIRKREANEHPTMVI